MCIRDRDSRYCVDGILCRIPEELFDLLLTDYQDFESVSYTHLDVYKRQVEASGGERFTVKQLERTKKSLDCLLYTSPAPAGGPSRP